MTMKPVEKITVTVRKRGLVFQIASNLLFWGTLLGTIGLSRSWFGGAWVIDIMAIVVAMGISILMMREYEGRDRYMTREELKAWVDAGMRDLQ